MARAQSQRITDKAREDHYQVIEQIADTVLGKGPKFDLRGRATRVARTTDPATAVSLVHSLAEHVAKHHDDTRPLEALVVLGFAHPKIVKEADVQLVHEGRRLAGLLERDGQSEQAQILLEHLAALDPADKGIDKDLAAIMRRTGNTERLVDRYLQRAEEAVKDGRRRDAVTWLREVLMLDRSRRDVARMIRDLQYADRQRKESWTRRIRGVLLGLVVCGIGAGVVYRELYVHRLYANLPLAQDGDLDSLRLRLANIDALIARNPLWLGMFQAGRERSKLRTDITKLEAWLDDKARIEENALAEHQVLIDSIRTRAILLVQQDDFAGALEQFERALEEAPEDWEYRERVETDVAAIREYLAEHEQAAEAEQGAAGEAGSEGAEPSAEGDGTTEPASEQPDEGGEPGGAEQP